MLSGSETRESTAEAINGMEQLLPWHRVALWAGVVSLWVVIGLGVLAAAVGDSLGIRGVGVSVCGLACVLGIRHLIGRRDRTASAAPLLPWSAAVNGLLLAIALSGVGLLCLRVEQTSDFGQYLKLGRALYFEGTYEEGGMYALRPPGMAVALGLPLRLGAGDLGAVWLVNSASALLAWSALRSALRRKSGDAWAVRLTALAVAGAATPLLMVANSEFPALAISAAACCLLPSRRTAIRRLPAAHAVGIGALLTIGAYFRPVLLVVLVVLLWAILSSHPTRCGRAISSGRPCAASLLCALLGAGLVAAPWTIRNWMVLGHLVPISTNAGETFYSANGSPVAREQGTYNGRLVDQLIAEVPDEVARSSEGVHRGIANIAAHPKAFLLSWPWRFERLYCNGPVWFAEYVAGDQERMPSGELSVILCATTLPAWWLLWLWGVRTRRGLVISLRDHEYVPWQAVSVILLTAAMMMFECIGRYCLTPLPFAVFALIEAQREPAAEISRDE